MTIINLEKEFEKYNVQGCFVLYDLKDDSYQIYNKKRAYTQFYPASTFKILNTIAAIETGIADDETFILKWDGIEREVPSHNQDQSLEDAYKNSTVWFYQEIARRIGLEKMQEIVNKANYGNKEIGNDVDKFWLKGPLKISAIEQIEFLKKLHLYQLPFSNKALSQTREIMIRKEDPENITRLKTGTTSYEDKQLGWCVGYIKVKNNFYFFAANMESPKPESLFDGAAFKARIPLTYEILAMLTK